MPDKQQFGCVIVGVDSYNLCTTGDVARALASERADNEHLPCVVVKAEGFDSYNQNLTGGVSMTLTAKRQDPHHVPCVVIKNEDIDRKEIL